MRYVYVLILTLVFLFGAHETHYAMTSAAPLAPAQIIKTPALEPWMLNPSLDQTPATGFEDSTGALPMIRPILEEELNSFLFSLEADRSV